MGEYGKVRNRFVKVVTMGRMLVFDTSNGKSDSAAAARSAAVGPTFGTSSPHKKRLPFRTAFFMWWTQR